MTILYRAISQNEKNDYDKHGKFRLAKNTLEVKQFFKSRMAVRHFVESSVMQDYAPPYVYLLIIRIDDNLLIHANPEEMKLDGFDAISVNEYDLPSFNNCIIFVKQELL